MLVLHARVTGLACCVRVVCGVGFHRRANLQSKHAVLKKRAGGRGLGGLMVLLLLLVVSLVPQAFPSRLTHESVPVQSQDELRQ
jgi:hypothetical protein